MPRAEDIIRDIEAVRKQLGPLPKPMKIIQSTMLVNPETYTEPRSWKERLFSLPWTPTVATKTCTRYIPRKDVLVSEVMGTVFMHPATYETLRRAGAIPAHWQ